MLNLTVIVGLTLFILGAMLGSFTGALVWRLKNKKDWIKGRSECESCGHQLSPSDLVPIFSWLFLRGRCRYCHKKIGFTPVILELVGGTAFLVSFLFLPFSASNQGDLLDSDRLIYLTLWLAVVIIMLILATYDYRYHLLPNKLVLIFCIFGLNFSLAKYFVADGVNIGNSFGDYLAYIGLGLIPITGIYGLIWLVSGGKLIGLGDVKLGVAIGLIVSFWGGVLVLGLSNLLAAVAVMPSLVLKKHRLNSRIAFGPYLLLATFLLVVFSDVISKFIFNMGFNF